jgi:hypothetical protein
LSHINAWAALDQQAGMTGVCHYTQLPVEMGYGEVFAWQILLNLPVAWATAFGFNVVLICS